MFTDLEVTVFKNLLFDRSWIHQRIEKFHIEKRDFMKRCSITLNVSDEVHRTFFPRRSLFSDRKKSPKYIFIPLGFSVDDDLVDFDASDNENQVLPMLSLQESRQICAKALIEYVAEQNENFRELGDRFHREYLSDLLALKRPSFDELKNHINEFDISSRKDLSKDRLIGLYQRLADVDNIERIYTLLVCNQILVAKVDRTNLPSIIKYRHKIYDQQRTWIKLSSFSLFDRSYGIVLTHFFSFDPDIVKVSTPDALVFSQVSLADHVIEVVNGESGAYEYTRYYESGQSDIVTESAGQGYKDGDNFRSFLDVSVKPKSFTMLLSLFLLSALMASFQWAAGLAIYDPFGWNVDSVNAEVSAALTCFVPC